MKALAVSFLLLGAFTAPAAAQHLPYPETHRGDTVDDYHGTRVADPYRWLEDLDGDVVASWVQAQNAVARPYLEAIPRRDALEARLAELWNYERFGVPSEAGGRYFYFRNDGLQDQSVLYVAEALDAAPRVLIDPNVFREDATVSLAGLAPSPDGRYVAYGLSDGGTDWRTWHVRDVATGEDLTDEIHGIKFSGVSWLPDASGFYYSRYPRGADGAYDDGRQVRIYFHRLGTPQADDALVYEITGHDTRNPYATVTDDGRFLIIDVFDGYDSNGVYVRDLSDPGAPVVRLLDAWDALYTFVGNDGETLFFETTNDAPRGRVVAVRPDAPAQWRTVIPESDETLQSVSYVGGRLVARYLQDARSRVRVFDTDGRHVRDVVLPGIGTAGGFDGHADDAETFFSFSSFTDPGAVYRYDVATGEATLWKRADTAGFDPADYRVEQVFYTSRDGTRVPMFVVHRRGLARDGDRPTLLYGYGGFNVSLTPGYSPARMAWLEMGGVLAIPNLRGGGEYGEAWHRAGTGLDKQNVFDDFIAAAEYLVDEGYTRPERLAIQGGSNGGLLVGAVMTQRPDLFGAALPAVGVLDMLRYHLPSANARQWSSDYGLSEDPAAFEALYAYSPYHNVAPGTCYPPTLVTTADHDDRVVPWHSFKFGAALQHAQACDNPVLLRIETRAGHGAGTPTWMRIEQAADQWAFLVQALGMDAMEG